MNVGLTLCRIESLSHQNCSKILPNFTAIKCHYLIMLKPFTIHLTLFNLMPWIALFLLCAL